MYMKFKNRLKKNLWDTNQSRVCLYWGVCWLEGGGQCGWWKWKYSSPFFFFFKAAPMAYGGSQSYSCRPQPQQLWDPSHVSNLHHSSGQRQILNPLSEARDWTLILMETSWILNPLSHHGNSSVIFLYQGLADIGRGKETVRKYTSYQEKRK